MKVLRIVAICLLAAAVAAFLLVIYWEKPDSLEKRGRCDFVYVKTVLPLDENKAAGAIKQAFQRRDAAGSPAAKLIPAKFSNFFVDDMREDVLKLLEDSERLPRGTRYSSWPEAKNHLVFRRLKDFYWPSEYYYWGRPARFTCDFLVRIDPLGPDRALVDVVELFPAVQLPYGRVRSVEQTTSDRMELLNVILKILGLPEFSGCGL